MKLSLSRTQSLPLLTAACGAVGRILRLLHNLTGTDGKGLLLPWHPAWIGVCAVTLAAAVIVFLGVQSIRGVNAYQVCFPASVPAAIGCVLGAVSTVITCVTHFRAGAISSPSAMTPLLFYIQGAVMALAAVSFLLIALCRYRGSQPTFLYHAVICLYFALQMLTLYQVWSFDPQLQRYCFQLFACIALTMTAYQLACFDMGKGSHRKLWAWGLAAVYLCCLSADSGFFFIAGGIWALTNLSTPRRRQRRTMAAEEPTNIE